MATEIPRLDRIIPTVAMELRATEVRPYRHRVSNVGECPRSLVYQRLGMTPTPFSGRTVLIFGDGNLHEDATVDWLDKTDFPVKYRQEPVDVGEIITADPFSDVYCDTCEKHIPSSILHGHIDGMIEIGDAHILFEHKAIGSFAYQLIDKEFPLGYIKQCCCYIKGLFDRGFNIDTALILLRSKDKATYKQMVIEYDHQADRCVMRNEWNELSGYLENVVQDCLDMHATVEEFAINGELIDRPYDYEDFHCQYCRYKNTCWDGYVAEVSARGSDNDLDKDGPVAVLAIQQRELTRQKAGIEKNLKEVKQRLKSAMGKSGIREGKFGSVSIVTRAFEKDTLDMDKIPDDIKKIATKKTPIVFVVVEDSNSGIS